MMRSWLSRAVDTIRTLIGVVALLTYLEWVHLRRWMRDRWNRG
jgi:hypothetical protein